MSLKYDYKSILTLDRRIFLVIFFTAFLIFVFTSDGHRFSLDEDTPREQAKRILLQEPHQDYVQGESRLFFDYPRYQKSGGAVCYNGVLCATAKIGHSLTELPFIAVNHQFKIITDDTVTWTLADFNDNHYVFWRNSQDPDFTFMELFFGPTFTALTVSVFYLVCRSYDYSRKISISLSLILAFSTTLWAYSQTSMNSVPATFFMIAGFYFFRKFQIKKNASNLLFSSVLLGFGFLVRPDSFLFIAVLFGFLVVSLVWQNQKIKKILAFVLPAVGAYYIQKTIHFIRFNPLTDSSSSASVVSNVTGKVPNLFGGHETPLQVGAFGLLFSPGIGLLIFAPILLTVFLSFPDFFKRNKADCLLILAIVLIFILFYGTIQSWHGLQSWAARYLIPIVPLMLIPLGATLERRQGKALKGILLVLVSAGILFNVSYLVQDVSWFVWGLPYQGGLYALQVSDERLHPLFVDAVAVWTWEYSQLTWSLSEAFSNLQPDIFLFKIFGPAAYFAILSGIITGAAFTLRRVLSKDILDKKTKTKIA